MNHKHKRRVRACAVQQQQQRHAPVAPVAAAVDEGRGVNVEELVPLAETHKDRMRCGTPVGQTTTTTTTTTTTVCGHCRITQSW